MEWLRKLLEEAKLTGEGKLDIDALMTSINAEFPKQAVPKAEYNNVKGQLKTANDTIADLKKNNADNEDLQTKIKEHSETIKTMENNHKAELSAIKKRGAIDSLLLKNKAKYSDLLADKFDLEKITIKDDGTIEGLEDQFKGIKESYKEMFEETESIDSKYVYKPKDGSSEVTKTFNMVDIVRENQSRK